MREKLRPWVPAIFCASLSLITIVSDVTIGILNRQKVGTNAAFFCFIPMAFYFVGAMHSQLLRENRELRQQLQEVIASSRATEPTDHH